MRLNALARRAAGCVLGALFAAAAARAEPEIWLASTPACNSCAIYREVAEARGYHDRVTYDGDHGDVRVRIREVSKDALDDAVLGQLPEDAGRGNPYWEIQLTVLVVDDGRVLAAGNIAESMDPALMRHSREIMEPPAAPDADDPAIAEADSYHDFFLAHWNLEYFLAVAFGDRLPRDDSPAVGLDSSSPLALANAAVVLWGSADRPLANALFISRRIREIRSELDGLGIPSLQFLTLYGHGPDSDYNDTSYLADGHRRFRRVDMPIDLDSSAESLERLFTGLSRAPGNRTLLVQVGHSGPAGSPLWGSLRTLAPEDLRALTDAGGADVIMVSGGCHSGLFARSVQCGFFAAHPDVLASGCQLSPEAIARSDDYLRYFFRSATRPLDAAGRLPSLAEAHWDAAERIEDHQIAYTTTDALIDAYFAAHPDALPESLTVAEVRSLAPALPAAERKALLHLAHGLAPSTVIGLDDLVERNHAAHEQLEEATELSSTERNAIIALPYKLMLPMLARRAVYRTLHVERVEFEQASACERQTVRSFLTRRDAPRERVR